MLAIIIIIIIIIIIGHMLAVARNKNCKRLPKTIPE